MANELTERWPPVLAQLQAADARLAEEIGECWRLWRSIVDAQRRGAEGPAALPADEVALAAYHRARSDSARRCLHEPLVLWEQHRPYRRALLAVERYDQSLEEIVRSLPESVQTSGHEIVAAFEGARGRSWRSRLAGLRRGMRPFPIRAIVAGALDARARARSAADGQLLLLLARAIRHLRPAWEITRGALDDQASGEASTGGRSQARWEKEGHSAQALADEANVALEAWRRSRALDLDRLVGSLLAAPRRPSGSGPADPRGAARAHWAEQGRTVESELRLELALDRAEEQILERLEEALAQARSERDDLLREADALIEWLRAEIARGSGEEPPIPPTEVVTHTCRLEVIEARLRSASALLPETTRTLARLSALPRRRPRWREMNPRRTLLHSYGRTARDLVGQAVRQIAADHGEIAREIARAREVVAYGLELDRIQGGAEGRVAPEALANALSLLEHYKTTAPDPAPSADSRLRRAAAAVFAEYRLILGRARLGARAYLAQEGFKRWAVEARRGAGSAVARWLPVLRRYLETAANRSLVFIGWKAASEAGRRAIVIRPVLPREFVVDLSTKEIPAIYRRLFPMTPVQDPRFLVGRSHEMEAVGDVRRLWEEGRSVGLLIVGERGSGKTSVVNCAVREHLADAPLVRGAFCKRLTTTEELRSFLAGLLGAPDPASIESFLAERRSVVILEELERTFLRRIGGYEAVKALQRVIAATCSSTLWVFAINQMAFRFLDAAVQLGASFSHRINVSTASRDVLREAILGRHHLSGLRLHFSRPPARTDWVGRARELLTRDVPAEKLFFDSLSAASDGVYRAAFDIWLGQVEQAEGGVLRMAPIISPDVSRIIKEFDLADLFSLLAILQHGGLTAEEHARIFQISISAARAQMDELLAREIIEVEPEADGLRVRPEATRIVKEALYRRNLV